MLPQVVKWLESIHTPPHHRAFPPSCLPPRFFAFLISPRSARPGREVNPSSRQGVSPPCPPPHDGQHPSHYPDVSCLVCSLPSNPNGRGGGLGVHRAPCVGRDAPMGRRPRALLPPPRLPPTWSPGNTQPSPCVCVGRSRHAPGILFKVGFVAPPSPFIQVENWQKKAASSRFGLEFAP